MQLEKEKIFKKYINYYSNNTLIKNLSLCWEYLDIFKIWYNTFNKHVKFENMASNII